MKFKTILFFFFGVLASLNMKAAEINDTKDSITVYVFLHESCLISQYYTLPLRNMHQEYANEQIQFIGLFPNTSSKPKKIDEFKVSHDIPFALKTDYYHEKTEALGASVTPEVVVYNESTEKILYKGRIDDSYARVGKRKRVTSTSELKEVLEAIKNDQPISVSNTKAIGCFIGKDKLN